MPAVRRSHGSRRARRPRRADRRACPPPDDDRAVPGPEIDAWLASDHEDETIARRTSRGGLRVFTAVEVRRRAPQRRRRRTRLRRRAEAGAAPEAAPAADARAPTPRRRAEPRPRQTERRRRQTRDRARRRRAARRADALDGRARDPPHRGRGAHRRPRDRGLQQAVQDLTRSSQALQAMVMQVRMIPVDVVFLRFPRLVRDLSTKLGKEVELAARRERDRARPHGRRRARRPARPPRAQRRSIMASSRPTSASRPASRATGTVEIAARHAGGSVVIEVRDDGSGIDPQAVARKAVSLGLIDAEAAATLDMRGAVELLFTPGFSTAETTSDISGRGVGMDAVRAEDPRARRRGRARLDPRRRARSRRSACR